MNSHISIGGRKVGPGEPCLFIAEAGLSHFGDMRKAIALVDLAAEAGADVFKTQAFHVGALVSERLLEWQERLRPKEVSLDFLARVKERCDDRGILFMFTAHDETVLPWLDELDVPAFKIGSGERGNLGFLQEHARRKKPIILSTGMYTMTDVRAAVDTISKAGGEELALLHCVTSYPTPYTQLNLRTIEQLRSLFPGPVGYSDHTDGHHGVLGAVALGADIVEKHISLDFNVPNAQDWKVAAGPHDLADLVRHVREMESALGGDGLRVQDCETAALEWALKSLVTTRQVAKGEVLTEKDLLAQRSGGGISPSQLEPLLGRSTIRPIAAGEPITWDDVV